MWHSFIRAVQRFILDCALMVSRALNFSPLLDTPPPTPVLRHFTGDPDSSPGVFGTTQNMANSAMLRLPEFWEAAAAAWFNHAEAQFAVHNVTDDDTRFYHVVTSMSCSTALKAESFVSAPPPHGKYTGLKAHLLELFELSQQERADRLLELSDLGDRKPSEHMRMMLNLLGKEDPGFLFIRLFLRHLPPHVRTALANTTITDPRELAAEADRFFLAARHPTPGLLAPVHARSPPRGAQRSGGRAEDAPDRESGWCYFHARFGAKAKKCRPPCSYVGAGNGGAHAQ